MTTLVELPFEGWPAVDRQLWHVIIQPPSVFLEGSRAAKWAPPTLKKAKGSYGRWLQWLQERGLLDCKLAPLERATRENLRQFVMDERQRVGLVTISTRLFHLIGISESFGPATDWEWLRRLRARVKRQAARLPNKRPRLVHARQMFDWSIGLMEQALATGTSGTVDIDLYLDGLMIAVMTAIALRIQNFASLRLEEQIRRIDDRWVILIDGAETKTLQAVAVSLPEALSPWHCRYAEIFRPRLLARQAVQRTDENAFWIGLDGLPLLSQGIRNRIKRRTAATFGKPILPHTFRKIAQTTFMVERPEYGAYAPALLGQASAQTMEKHYFIAQGQIAIETYHELDGRNRRKSAVAEGVEPETMISFNRKLKAFIVGSVVTQDTRRFGRPPVDEQARSNGESSPRRGRPGRRRRWR
jgi:hypothetical protein